MKQTVHPAISGVFLVANRSKVLEKNA